MRGRRLFVVVAALAALHALVCFPYPWEKPSLAAALARPSPDLVLLLAVGIVLGLRLGPRRWIVRGVALLALFVPLWRFGATAMPAFRNEEFDVWNHVLLLPDLFHLLTHRLPVWQRWAAVAAAAAGGGVAWLATCRVVRAVLGCAADRKVAAGLLVAFQLLVAADWVSRSAGAGGQVLARGVLADAGGQIVGLLSNRGGRLREMFSAREATALEEERTTPRDLSALEGADVFVILLESYGAALARGEAREQFAAWTRQFEARLEAAGLQASTGLATSPVRGGGSTMAHTELFTGVQVESPREQHLVLQSRLVPLPRVFAEAGYRTVFAQPDLPGPWTEERRFFGFEEVLHMHSFPYRGRIYHWGVMPDQYALAYLLKEIVRPARRPLFLVYVAGTSHPPCSMVPPYLEDWEAAAEPEAFAGEPLRTYPLDWSNFTGHPQAETAWLDCMRYSLDVALGFAERLPRRALVLILGDHQPPVVGPLTGADRTRDVIFHALAPDPALLAPFRVQGFRPGLLPGDAPPFRFHRFRYRFLWSVQRRPR